MKARRGFSLLEVLLATAILVGSLVVLSELAAIGRIHASAAEDGAAAVRICRSVTSAILAGIEPVSPVREQPVDDEPGWLYSVEVEPVDRPGLVAIRVTVRQEEAESGRPVEFSLVRWIRDPRQPAGDRTPGGEGLQLLPGFRRGRMQ
jgi:prepilin-type N-terminal cleavage/methylation domain-containing protein